MTRVSACALAQHGISLNAVVHGNAATPMNVHLRTHPEFKPMLGAMIAHTSSSSTSSTVAEMAGMFGSFVSGEPAPPMAQAC